MNQTHEPTRRPYAKTEQVLTTVTEKVRDRLDAYAVEHEVSRAEAMRSFIVAGLDRWDEEKLDRERRRAELEEHED